jgi:hypothetical protein
MGMVFFEIETLVRHKKITISSLDKDKLERSALLFLCGYRNFVLEGVEESQFRVNNRIFFSVGGFFYFLEKIFPHFFI